MKKIKPRRRRVNLGNVEFKRDYLDGPRIIIDEENTTYENGKAIHSTTLNLKDRYMAMQLFEQARLAVEWHRQQVSNQLKTIENCLAGE